MRSPAPIAGLLTTRTGEEARFEIEFLLKLVDAFALTDRLGAPLPEVYTDVWAKLYGRSVDVDAAAGALYRMLGRRTSVTDWVTLSAQIHNEINVVKRPHPHRAAALLLPQRAVAPGPAQLVHVPAEQVRQVRPYCPMTRRKPPSWPSRTATRRT